MRSSRYMNGGRSEEPQLAAVLAAARGPGHAPPPDLALTLSHGARARLRSHTHVPYQRVGPSRLPDFDLPFTTTLSPHLDGAAPRRRRLGPPHGHAGAAAGRAASRTSGTRQRLRRFDFPLCAAGIHPDATPDDST